MKDDLYIVMPAYNEEAVIRSVVESWYAVLRDKTERSRLVIADQGSRDRTHEILLDMQKNGYPQLEIHIAGKMTLKATSPNESML